MTYLLDVNVLLAAIWNEHPHHQHAFEWIKGKNVAVCPISELGFIRISTNAKSSFNAEDKLARKKADRFGSPPPRDQTRGKCPEIPTFCGSMSGVLDLIEIIDYFQDQAVVILR